MLNTMLNGLTLAILTNKFLFKSTPGVGFGWGSLEPFGCYFGIQYSVKLITNKISDRVGCLCAILVLFARLFVGMRRSFRQCGYLCNSNTIGCSLPSRNLLISRVTGNGTLVFVSEWRFHELWWLVPYV